MPFKFKLEMLPWLLGMLIVTSCVHEAGHAWAAWRSGDRRDYIKKRANPVSFSHISLIFTIILPAVMILFVGFMFGGAKPVQVRMDIGPGKMALVALAGPAANFLVAALGLLGIVLLVHMDWMDPYPNVLSHPTHYFYALFAVGFSVFLGLLNLIPIPPLDGSRVVAAFMPEKWRYHYYKTLAIPGMILLFVGFICLAFIYADEFGRATMAFITDLHETRGQIQDWVTR